MRIAWPAATGAALAGLLVLAIALGGRVSADPPDAAPASLPEAWAGHSMCVECHSDQALPIHGALLGAPRGPRIECESCHGPGAAHAQDPTAAAMPALDSLPAADTNRACATCHTLPFESDGLQHQHARAGLRCTECHDVHGQGKVRALLRESPITKCGSCHTDVAAEMRHVSHHPVLDGRLDCATCHVPALDAVAARSPRGANAKCVTCHAEHDVLTPFEHVAASEVALEGEGCTVCHAPHGSSHARLLRRPGDALCLQCHTVPGHQVAHNGAYAGIRCQECHVDVHGSYTNRALLTPRPLGQDCLVCHGQ
jgi:DmsE family decaheme c-type cytochrome